MQIAVIYGIYYIIIDNNEYADILLLLILKEKNFV